MIDNKQILLDLYPNIKLYGPYFRKKDSRAYYVRVEMDSLTGKIYKSNKKSTILVSRLKMEIKLKRRLTDEEQVDHIDGNPYNDSDDNLQLMSIEEHRKKSGKENKERCDKRINITCPCCKKVFLCKSSRLVSASNKNRIPTCSRSCASTFYGANQHSWRGLGR